MPYTEAREIMSVESLFLRCSAEKLAEFLGRIEVCLGKLSEDQIWARGAGRWIISSLGGKPDHRDTVEGAVQVISSLNTERLTREYEIQNYQVSGVEAVYHVVEHFGQHTGQIIFATKMLTRTDLGFYRRLPQAM